MLKHSVTVLQICLMAMFLISCSDDSNPFGSNPTGPSISAQPADAIVNISQNQSATFTVSATGNGLSYQWYRDGVLIEGATESSYILTEITAEDNGAVFTCIVSGSDGTVTSEPAVLTITTVVISAPQITSHPSDSTVQQGQPVTFAVAANGDFLNYQWYRNEIPIPNATESTYTINTVHQSLNNSVFRCVVFNSVGEDQSNEAVLTVTGSDGDGTVSGLIGSWVLIKEEDIELEDGVVVWEYSETYTLAESWFAIEVTSNTVIIHERGHSPQISGYTISGNTATLTDFGMSFQFQIVGQTLIFTQDFEYSDYVERYIDHFQRYSGTLPPREWQ
ncbi:immunoglobulin I-set domain-containing protein [Chitinispirillum alkaliphilum]|nr:immunoglobulin I-set domain-containing protein [Chitinispirillum alkaliphilum]